MILYFDFEAAVTSQLAFLMRAASAPVLDPFRWNRTLEDLLEPHSHIQIVLTCTGGDGMNGKLFAGCPRQFNGVWRARRGEGGLAAKECRVLWRICKTYGREDRVQMNGSPSMAMISTGRSNTTSASLN